MTTIYACLAGEWVRLNDDPECTIGEQHQPRFSGGKKVLPFMHLLSAKAIWKTVSTDWITFTSFFAVKIGESILFSSKL